MAEEAHDSARCASTLSFRVADGLLGPPVTTPKR
jgi:hypothetical protein